jgi:MFS family permease
MRSLPLRPSLRRIVVGGALAMVFSVGISSPVTTEFYRALGATEFHFGLITGVPLLLLSLQFAGAAFANSAVRRKPTFMVCLIACRLLYLPIAFLPELAPGLSVQGRVGVVLALLAASTALHNFAIPFWFSWMADLVPRRALNRFWGVRQFWMHVVWTASYLMLTLFLYRTSWPATVTFPILALLAVGAGIADILLFRRVREPVNLVTPGLRAFDALRAPLRHPDFRTFITFSCFFSMATMFTAPFLQLYILKELGVAPWKTGLIWCGSGIGVMLSSAGWGRLADRHGQRPVINLSVTGKSMIMIVFLLLTRDNVVWLLPLAFAIDGVFNSGNMVAFNGYMLSIAPQANRSMFIASITGLSGIVGGLSAMVAGALFKAIGPGSIPFAGRTWTAYHAVFAFSLLLRWVCVRFARRIREPGSAQAASVLQDVFGEPSGRILRFPSALYRRLLPPADRTPES